MAGIASGLACLPDILPDYAPAPSVTERGFWTALSAPTRAALIADAEAVLASGWPVLTAAVYRAFVETGNRADFEALYFERRRRINALALAEVAEDRGRFIDALVDGLVLVCEESGWQLPAHNSQERDGAFDPLPDPDRPVVDLFAAETGAQLALVTRLLGPRLSESHPMVVARISREIETRITSPYLNRHFWWMGRTGEKMMNWTPWCTQNVLISTFCRASDQATRRKVIAQAADSLDIFMDGYGEDGACEEGTLYYRHAAICLFGALSVMEAVAPGTFAPILSTQKLRNMADYGVNTHVAGRNYINFADASAVLPPAGAREFLFGKAVGSDALRALAAADAAGDLRDDLPEERNLFDRLRALVAAGEIRAHAARDIAKPDIFYQSRGLFIARDARFVLAAKAGDNDDAHNHNDVGSVTLYRDGKPLLIDVGVETYSKKTFSPDRYDIWTMQSLYHNLPHFGGVGQGAGKAFAARDVRVALDADAAEIEMDIAGAYPEQAGVSRYVRRVRLDKIKGVVTLADRFEGTISPELVLMLAQEPALADGEIRVGDLATVRLEGAGLPRVDAIAITDPRLKWAWPDTIYRVLVPFAGNDIKLTIE